MILKHLIHYIVYYTTNLHCLQLIVFEEIVKKSLQLIK